MPVNKRLKYKYVSEVETFALDWEDYLADANNGAADTLATATWTVESGLTKDADSISGTKTLVRVSGGTAGQRYTCLCQITLNSGSDTPIDYLVVAVIADP